MKDYIKTSDSYVKWVANSELRNFFSKNIKIDNFSLWWATNICRKDNVVFNRWFYELKDILIDDKKKKFNQINFYTILLLKFTKNFLVQILWYALIKIISFTRYNKIIKKNCFHSYNYNFTKNNQFYSDRFYGECYTKYSKNNFFLITVARKKQFLLEIFKKKQTKKNLPIIIADEFVNLRDVFYINFKTFFLLLKLFIYIKRNKNIFFIEGKNCRNIIEPLLISSFAGSIQNQIFIGLGLNKFLRTNKVKTFITYSEFNPSARSVYFFIRNLEKPPQIVAFQHGNSNANLLYCRHSKNEFTSKLVDDGGYFSPAPDYYLTQGPQYSGILKKYFPRKTKIIGALKFDTYKFDKKINNKILEKLKLSQKKIVLICPSVGDEDYILEYLKKSLDRKNLYILSPHPSNRKIVIEKYLHELKKICEVQVFPEISTNNFLKISDIVLCGYSTVAYEALFFGVQPIRIINPKLPQFHDVNDKVQTANHPKKLKIILNAHKLRNKSYLLAKYIENYFFYKLDNKAHIRFWKFINKLK